MGLTDAEELELLQMERDRAGVGPSAPKTEGIGSKILNAGKEALGSVQKFGQGAMEGATHDTITVNDRGNLQPTAPEPASVPGSIMREDGSAKPSFMEKNFTPGARNFGHAVGSLIPLVVSELLAGAPAEALALKYGMGPVKTAMSAAGMTMATYEGLKGAVQAKPPADTASNMASGYMTAMPIGAAGYGISKLGKYAANDLSEGLADQYLYTQPKVNQSQLDKGQPGLGKKFLKETSYGGSMSKPEVYSDIGGKLENNRILIKDMLEKADAEAAANSQYAGREPIYKFSRGQNLEQGGVTNETYQRGALGEPILIKKEPEMLGYRYKRGGAYAGNPPIEQPPGTYEPGSLGEPNKVSNMTVGKGGGINLDEMRAAAGPISQEQSDIGSRSAANSVDDLMSEYGVAAGERVVTNSRAYQLLGRLDADVNKAYQALDPNTISPSVEAKAAMANKLRGMLRANVPGIGDLLSQNHTLQMAESSLAPQVAPGPLLKKSGEWLRPLIAKAIGGQAGLGVARGLEAAGTPGTLSNTIISKGIAPTASAAAKLGLADHINKVRKDPEFQKINGKILERGK